MRKFYKFSKLIKKTKSTILQAPQFCSDVYLIFHCRGKCRGRRGKEEENVIQIVCKEHIIVVEGLLPLYVIKVLIMLHYV